MDGRAEKQSWEFDEGDEITPGLSAVRLLGGGRRYEAYLAWDALRRALVVAKVARPPYHEDGRTKQALAEEGELLAALRHPVLPRLFDASLEADVPLLVLEFLDGPRLSTLVRRHGVILEQALPLALEVCSALHYLANVGIVHLDVKPKNLIMGAPPRLIDLSVAHPIEAARALEAPVGTDGYMAPEQCDPGRFAEIGPATDVWGLGVTLFEALARSLPFPRGRPGDATLPLAERYPQTAKEPDRLPREVPEPVADAVYACLADEPAARPSADELADLLEPIVASLPGPRLGRFRPGQRIGPRP